MKILTYKRTHTGDPNVQGVFGCRDCMGRDRGWAYDAVIGIGGTGGKAKSFGLKGKITWIGVGPIRRYLDAGRGPEVAFDRFVLYDEQGPNLFEMAPNLARRMYGGRVRSLLSSYSPEEKAEAEQIIRSFLNGELPPGKKGRVSTSCKTPREASCSGQRNKRPAGKGCGPQPC
ncbi:hypothetical protein [Pseudomonas knackmussii]|uniref:hypothetical protein n=1 Tax=Pseudomonas knackmussii TaxID=65741 RepID=UPI00136242D8|nr:hypothetical protein [Pseudomonas knackmussii]